MRSEKYRAQAISLHHARASALTSPISWCDAREATSGASTDLNTTFSPQKNDTAGFDAIFLHSTINGHPGTTPGSGANYDTGLLFADSYYLEAIDRLLKQDLIDCDGNLSNTTNATTAAAAAGRQNTKSAAVAKVSSGLDARDLVVVMAPVVVAIAAAFV